MGSANNLFKRIEKKYLLSPAKYRQLITALEGYIVPDEYAHNTICSMYYDTPDFRLIRSSIEKPLYKEKLRLRSYGVPDPDSNVFVEIKKKFDGVVYKRRLKMDLSEAEAYLNEGILPLRFLAECPAKGDNRLQVYNEIDHLLSFYDGIRPAMFLSYERDSYFARDDRDLRITFDSDITYRCRDLSLSHGIYGSKLIGPDQHLMEIKIPGAMPLWLSHILDELKIRSSSFTKYGNAYKQELTGGQAMKGVYIND